MPGSYRPTQSLCVLVEPNHYQIMTLIEYLMFQLKQAAFFVILHQLLTITLDIKLYVLIHPGLHHAIRIHHRVTDG